MTVFEGHDTPSANLAPSVPPFQIAQSSSREVWDLFLWDCPFRSLPLFGKSPNWFVGFVDVLPAHAAKIEIRAGCWPPEVAAQNHHNEIGESCILLPPNMKSAAGSWGQWKSLRTLPVVSLAWTNLDDEVDERKCILVSTMLADTDLFR